MTRALSTFLAVLVLLALPAAALASDEVRIEPEGAVARTLTLSNLGEPDVRGREYTVSDGAGVRRVAITGHSLDRVLAEAGVDPYRFRDVEVSRGGASVTLDRDEVTDQGAFPDGPPVFWMEGAESRFLRPGSASEASLQIWGTGQITIRLGRASALEVRARASDRRVEAGRRVTFTAKVSGAPDGASVEVSWYFDDGRSAGGMQVTHRFRKPGTYDVLVGATMSPDDPGADATISVRVGKPPDGPNRKGGGTNPDADAPDSGAGTGPSGPGGGGSAGGDASNGGGEAAARDEEAAAAPRRARRRKAAARERRERAARERDEDPAEPARSSRVRGIELADVSALSSDAGRDALRAARRGRLREEDDSGGAGIPPAVWWTLGTAALLGLGGWREARTRPVGRPA